jgi:hypothetical protein
MATYRYFERSGKKMRCDENEFYEVQAQCKSCSTMLWVDVNTQGAFSNYKPICDKCSKIESEIHRKKLSHKIRIEKMMKIFGFYSGSNVILSIVLAFALPRWISVYEKLHISVRWCISIALFFLLNALLNKVRRGMIDRFMPHSIRDGFSWSSHEKYNKFLRNTDMTLWVISFMILVALAWWSKR